MVSAQAVFPIEGRAASTFRELGCRPAVRLSSSLKPVRKPDTGSGLLKSSLICANVSVTSVFMPSKAWVRLGTREFKNVGFRLVENLL